jgi:hypothetical protein
MLGQPVSSSTSLNDAAVHSYHDNKKNNSLLSPSMPRRQGSFSKKAGAMAPSPPTRSVSNNEEASQRYVEGILGKALEHCSLESLESPRRPSRRHIKEATMLGQPVSSSTSLEDADLHRYHKHKQNNSFLSPAMPRHQGSFSMKAGVFALPSPPVWSDSNNEEASPSHDHG